MGRLLSCSIVAALALGGRSVAAHDFDLSVDLRAVAADGQTSYLHGGGGKLRFDDEHEGLQVGSLRLGYRGDVTDTLRFTAEAFGYDDGDKHPLDLTEVLLSWRPIPQSLWRSEVKVGAFYPAISLENRMRGWRSPYTTSFSAINSWVGEELRTIGLEYNLDWLGQQDNQPFNVGATAAVYGWNDPAGVVIALRGWSLHDRQTTLFGRIGTPDAGIIDGRTLFYHDIDGRAGYYVGVNANYRGALELRLFHYDNLGDPAAIAPAINDGAWRTKFDSAGLRWTPADSWTVIWQYLHGYTYIGALSPPNSWRFESQFLLASWKRGAHRLSLRYDDFSMQQWVSRGGGLNSDDGNAITAAYTFEFNEHWSAALESMRVDSDLQSRRWVGAPVSAVEKQLQLALRFEL